MKIMLEFIRHEYLSMSRAGSSDPEPPIACPNGYPADAGSARRLDHLQHDLSSNIFM